jgi:hypothetical protein
MVGCAGIITLIILWNSPQRFSVGGKEIHPIAAGFQQRAFNLAR